MAMNKNLRTDLIKEMEKKYPNAAILYQDIWMHAADLFMDDTDEPPINNEELRMSSQVQQILVL